MAKWILRLIAFTYLAFLLVIPVGIITHRTFERGAGKVADHRPGGRLPLARGQVLHGGDRQWLRGRT